MGLRRYGDLAPDRSMGRASTRRMFGTPVASCHTTVALPQWRDPAGCIPFFWCFPGANTGLRVRRGLGSPTPGQGVPNTHWPDFRPIAALGYPVFGNDLRTIDGFGDPTTLANLDTLIAWAGSEFGCRTDRYMLGGESKGAFAVLNNAWRNPNKIAALWVRGPGLNLAALHARNPFGFTAADIETSYGGLAAYTAALPTHDPSHPNNIARMSTLAKRLRIDANTGEEIVPPSEVATYAAAVGCDNVNWHAGGHAMIWNTPTAEVADWLDQQARGVRG